ncbi:MAG TPA: hypothetical protein VIG33_14705 [Pseudobdellovibrionaceae bacterium]|jgi:hypothetical protein
MLSEADKELLKKFEHSCSDARIGDVADLLSIIDRQSKALAKCVEQRNDLFDPGGECPPDQHIQALKDYNKELKSIMQGGGE